MDKVYFWARIMALVFVFFLVLVTSLPFVIVILTGVDDSTAPMLLTSTLFLIPLVFMALSYRFMHKGETKKKNKTGFVMFIFMLITLFVYSLFAEKAFREKQANELAYLHMKNELHYNPKIASEVSNHLKQVLKELDEKQTSE